MSTLYLFTNLLTDSVYNRIVFLLGIRSCLAFRVNSGRSLFVIISLFFKTFHKFQKREDLLYLADFLFFLFKSLFFQQNFAIFKE